MLFLQYLGGQGRVYFLPSNIFMLKSNNLHEKIWVKTLSVNYFQCSDNVVNINSLFCSHNGNLIYIIVQKREKVVKDKKPDRGFLYILEKKFLPCRLLKFIYC